MRIVNKFPPRFFADDGETITINVTAQNPNMVFLVTYKVGEQEGSLAQGSAAEFQMSKTFPQLIFALQLGFQPADGTGSYAVNITGKPGEGTYNGVFDSKFGVDPLGLPFEFKISNI